MRCRIQVWLWVMNTYAVYGIPVYLSTHDVVPPFLPLWCSEGLAVHLMAEAEFCPITGELLGPTRLRRRHLLQMQWQCFRRRAGALAMKKWNRIRWLKWFSDSETLSLLWFGVITMNSRCCVSRRLQGTLAFAEKIGWRFQIQRTDWLLNR